MHIKFKNKIILVTGASKGIGEEIIKIFSKLDAFVIGSSRTKNNVKKIDNIIHKLGGKGIGIKMDLSNYKDIENGFQYMKINNILPNILINNAGINHDNLILRMSDEQWIKVINVNLNGIFKISKLAIRYMIKHKWGRIINIGSVVGSIGNIGQTNYCASKAGIIGFSKALAKEIAKNNITVNVIAPGFVKTDMTESLSNDQKQTIINHIPLRKIGQKCDIANLSVFLASEYANYITGQTIHINGGMYMN